MATRILVVDDSPTIRHIVSTLLERNGYEPKVASDGEDAYEALASGEVEADLVLLDFVMPRMNGFQFCRAIRANQKLEKLPVVLMSAKGDKIRDQFVEQTGALDAITKPFDAQALVAVVENALRKLTTARSSERLPDFDENDLAKTDERVPAMSQRDLSQPAISSPPSTSRPRPILEGDLGVIPIGAILQLLQAENQTGVLVCRRDKFEVRAYFREGEIDLVQSSGAGDEFRLGRFFVEEGILAPGEIDDVNARTVHPLGTSASIDPGRTDEVPASTIQKLTKSELARTSESLAVTVQGDVLTHALAVATQKPKPLGMALLAAGKIDADQLRTALTRQSSELLYEVLRWSYGRFELKQEPPSELAEEAQLSMPVASVVMEGFRRVDEWRAIERTLGSFDTVLVRDDLAFGRLDLKELPPREKAVLDMVDGDRTVRAIAIAGFMSTFDVCRIVVQFLEARVLRRR
ncbi:MAG: response regulator [Labilithrix sp.]